MSEQAEEKSLAVQSVAAGLSAAKQELREGNCKASTIRQLGGLARLLEEGDLVKQAQYLLRKSPDKSFWLDAALDVRRPSPVPDWMLEVPPVQEIEDQFPLYRESQISNIIRTVARASRHISFCQYDKYSDAIALAQSEKALHEIAATQAFRGDFDAAQRLMLERIKAPARKKGILIVLVVELFRRGHPDLARWVLIELQYHGLNARNNLHLALGFAGRQPWWNYPFPEN